MLVAIGGTGQMLVDSIRAAPKRGLGCVDFDG
jgi:hypothetical protein